MTPEDEFSVDLRPMDLHPTEQMKAEARAEEAALLEAWYQQQDSLRAEMDEMDLEGPAKVLGALPAGPVESVPPAGVQVLDDDGNWVDGAHLEEVDKAVERMRVLRDARAVFAAEVGAFGVFDASKVIDINDLGAQTATDYLIEGILERGAVTMLFADGYVGKSFLVLSWAMCIASRTDWEGHAVKSGRTLYVALEGHATFPKRLAAWRGHFGQSSPTGSVEVYPATVNLLDPTSVTALTNYVTAGQFDLIVIDTLNRAVAGGDENSTEQMGAFMASLAQVREAHEPSHIVVLHHSKKDDPEKYRGASVLNDGFDNVLCLRRVKLGDDATSKADPHRKLIFQKVKSGQPAAPLALVFEQVPNTGSAVLIRDTFAGVDPIVRHLITTQSDRGPGGAVVTRAEFKKVLASLGLYKDERSANARISGLIKSGLLTHDQATDALSAAITGRTV